MTDKKLEQAIILERKIDAEEFHRERIKDSKEFDDYESVTLRKEFFPYPIKDFMDLYLANLEKKITDLKDEFGAL